MSIPEKTVFISYRRKQSQYAAAYIYRDLRQNDFDVFWDIEGIGAGDFGRIILNQIAARTHFLVLLAPGTLDRCSEPGDWLRREIEYALERERNIIPIYLDNFTPDDAEKHLTGRLKLLKMYQQFPLYISYLDVGLQRLREQFLVQPEHAVPIKQVPAEEQAIILQQIEEADRVYSPTAKQLKVEEYLNGAYKKLQTRNIDGAIADYTAVIELDPDNIDAYELRSLALAEKGEYDGVIEDINTALKLSQKATRRPGYQRTATERVRTIIAYLKKMNISTQETQVYAENGRRYLEDRERIRRIIDHLETSRLNRQLATAYVNRGNALKARGNVDAAIADYTEAIHADPKDSSHYALRAEAYFSLMKYESALKDFQKARQVNPNSDMAVAGMALCKSAMGEEAEATRMWAGLINADFHFQDEAWLRDKLAWGETIITEARKLINQLRM